MAARVIVMDEGGDEPEGVAVDDPAGWYAAFEVDPATPDDAMDRATRGAWLRMARTSHPDKGGGDDSGDVRSAWSAVRTILCSPSLRRTYHTKGAQAALDGEHAPLPTDTHQLHTYATRNVTLQELANGGLREIKVERRVDGHVMQCTHILQWGPGTPEGYVIRVVGMGDALTLPDCVPPRAPKTWTGDMLITLQCPPETLPGDGEGAMHAIGYDLHLVVPGNPLRMLVGSPVTFPHPDGRRCIVVCPPPDAPFAPFMHLPGAGLSERGAAWVRFTAVTPIRGTVPHAAKVLICDANAFPAPMQPQEDAAEEWADGAAQVVWGAACVTDVAYQSARQSASRIVQGMAAESQGMRMVSALGTDADALAMVAVDGALAGQTGVPAAAATFEFA